MDITARFDVPFGYEVILVPHLFQGSQSVLRDVLQRVSTTGKVLGVVDAGALAAHPALPDRWRALAPDLDVRGELLVLPGGEAVKNDWKHVEAVLNAIHARGICRHSAVVAIGGGAVLDAVGLAAALAHRGVRLVRVPTTVLAQNDSGVGVKNGVNCFGKKNFLGTFAPPAAVLNDVHFLTTLDERNWRAGVSEAVKVALLQDAAFFTEIEALTPALCARDLPAMARVVQRCAALHVAHIQGGDPFEAGSSRPLDFGHWAAHKLEQLTDFTVLHGEAVAIGLALDVAYSTEIGWLPASTRDRILRALARLGFTLYHPALRAHLDDPTHPDSLLRGLTEFQEHLGGQLTIMLLREIGQGEEVHAMEAPAVAAAVDFLKVFSAPIHAS